jgi:hypothetical protein
MKIVIIHVYERYSENFDKNVIWYLRYSPVNLHLRTHRQSRQIQYIPLTSLQYMTTCTCIKVKDGRGEIFYNMTIKRLYKTQCTHTMKSKHKIDSYRNKITKWNQMDICIKFLLIWVYIEYSHQHMAASVTTKFVMAEVKFPIRFDVKDKKWILKVSVD